MSPASELANHASSIDWNVVAAAAATFVGTLVVTIWGWMQGKKRLHRRLAEALPENAQFNSVALLDNLTLREATLVNKEVRDQLLLHSHAINAHCKATEDNTQSLDDLLREVKDLRRDLLNRR